MAAKYKIRDHVYIVESKRYIHAGTTIGSGNGFYTVRFDDDGGIRVRESRIYAIKADSENTILKKKPSCRSHYDVWLDNGYI